MTEQEQTFTQLDLFSEVIDYIKDQEEDLQANGTEPDYLLDNIFNDTEHYIYYSEAAKALSLYGGFRDGLGTFQAIQTVQDYERDYLGKTVTDFGDPCAVANKLYYILGLEALRPIVDRFGDSYGFLNGQSIKELLDFLEEKRAKALKDKEEGMYNDLLFSYLLDD